MKRQAVLSFVVLAPALAVVVRAEDKEEPAPAVEKSAPLRTVPSSWPASGSGTASGHGPDEKEVHVQFKVTSGGSAVVETGFPVRNTRWSR